MTGNKRYQSTGAFVIIQADRRARTAQAARNPKINAPLHEAAAPADQSGITNRAYVPCMIMNKFRMKIRRSDALLGPKHFQKQLPRSSCIGCCDVCAQTGCAEVECVHTSMTGSDGVHGHAFMKSTLGLILTCYCYSCLQGYQLLAVRAMRWEICGWS